MELSPFCHHRCILWAALLCGNAVVISALAPTASRQVPSVGQARFAGRIADIAASSLPRRRTFLRADQRRQLRRSTPMAAGGLHDADWWPMEELAEDDKRAMLILVRHGQSEWNFANRFIGWYDSPLTDEGMWEAEEAGRLLKRHRIEVDEVHTSMLSRTLQTATEAVKILQASGLEVPGPEDFKATWRLNERSYGALTGRNKKECTKQYGKDQLKLWRRSWDIPPPQYEDGCELYGQETDAFQHKVRTLVEQGLYNATRDPPPEQLPRGESLKCTQQRLLPYWEDQLLPKLQSGKRVMVFGHENNLRALVKLLDDIDEESILEVSVPRAIPMVYLFDRSKVITGTANKAKRLQPIRLTPPDAAEGDELLSARYLVDQSLLTALHKRDQLNVYDVTIDDNLEEVCMIEEETEEVCTVIDEYHRGGAVPDEDEDEFVSSEREAVSVSAGGPSMPRENTAAFVLPHSSRREHPDEVSWQPWRSFERGQRASYSDVSSSSSNSGSGAALLAAGVSLLGSLAAAVRKGRRSKGTSQLRHGGSASTGISVEMGTKLHPLTCRKAQHTGVASGPASIPARCPFKPTAICNLPCDHELGDEVQSGATAGAEEEICELIGHDFGDQLVQQIQDAFTDEERSEAWERCGFHDAKSCDKPQAIWLLGPSAVGKSTLAPHVARDAGMEEDGCVLIDGEPFRDSHTGFQAALHEGQQRGCVFWGAYVGIRENVNDEKQHLLLESMKAGKNLLLPSTCLRRAQSLETAHALLKRGYIVNVVCLFGEKYAIARRGRARALKNGKRYNPNEFEVALGSFAPMLRLCNGWYRMYENNAEGLHLVSKGDGPVDEEVVHQLCDEVAQAYWSHMAVPHDPPSDREELTIRTW